MMTKKEFISQLRMLASSYADERIGDINRLFASNQQLREEKQEWEQKYHSAMAANKKLEEQNENLSGEVSEWKSENHSINALNVTLSEKLQKLEERCASQYQDLLKQEQSSQNWQGNYYAMQQLKDSLAKELDVVKAKLEEAEETIKDRQERYDEAYKVGNKWFEDFKELTSNCEKLNEELAAAEERHEWFKKKSNEILATTEENLRKKQEQIEALTTWKEGTEKVLDSLDARLKNAKDVIHTQENTIEWLDGRVKRLKAKKAKKEQND